MYIPGFKTSKDFAAHTGLPASSIRYHMSKGFCHIEYRQKDHPLFSTWGNIIGRCKHKGNKDYKNYGGRGIKLEWSSFTQFVQDMGAKPGPTYTVERVDNDGPYCKSNCIWLPKSQQALNRRPMTPRESAWR